MKFRMKGELSDPFKSEAENAIYVKSGDLDSGVTLVESSLVFETLRLWRELLDQPKLYILHQIDRNILAIANRCDVFQGILDEIVYTGIAHTSEILLDEHRLWICRLILRVCALQLCRWQFFEPTLAKSVFILRYTPLELNRSQHQFPILWDLLRTTLKLMDPPIALLNEVFNCALHFFIFYASKANDILQDSLCSLMLFTHQHSIKLGSKGYLKTFVKFWCSKPQLGRRSVQLVVEMLGATPTRAAATIISNYFVASLSALPAQARAFLSRLSELAIVDSTANMLASTLVAQAFATSWQIKTPKYTVFVFEILGLLFNSQRELRSHIIQLVDQLANCRSIPLMSLPALYRLLGEVATTMPSHVDFTWVKTNNDAEICVNLLPIALQYATAQKTTEPLRKLCSSIWNKRQLKRAFFIHFKDLASKSTLSVEFMWECILLGCLNKDFSVRINAVEAFWASLGCDLSSLLKFVQQNGTKAPLLRRGLTYCLCNRQCDGYRSELLQELTHKFLEIDEIELAVQIMRKNKLPLQRWLPHAITNLDSLQWILALDSMLYIPNYVALVGIKTVFARILSAFVTCHLNRVQALGSVLQKIGSTHPRLQVSLLRWARNLALHLRAANDDDRSALRSVFILQSCIEWPWMTADVIATIASSLGAVVRNLPHVSFVAVRVFANISCRYPKILLNDVFSSIASSPAFLMACTPLLQQQALSIELLPLINSQVERVLALAPHTKRKEVLLLAKHMLDFGLCMVHDLVPIAVALSFAVQIETQELAIHTLKGLCMKWPRETTAKLCTGLKLVRANDSDITAMPLIWDAVREHLTLPDRTLILWQCGDLFAAADPPLLSFLIRGFALVEWDRCEAHALAASIDRARTTGNTDLQLFTDWLRRLENVHAYI